jgi:hypothetical protein
MQDKYTGSLTPQEQAEVVRLHDEQYSGREIARNTGLTYGRVRGFLEWHLEEFSGEFPEPRPILRPSQMGLASPPTEGPAVLVYDIETAPVGAWVWGAYKTNIIGVMDGHDWYLLSFAYKWLGQKGTHYVSHAHDPAFFPHTTNDLYVAERLASLLDAADVVIAHNGDNFDQKKTNSRILFHGIDPPSPYQQIDTLKEARRYFNNIQNSLKELGRIYTKEEKMRTSGFELWLGCMAGDPAYLAEMEKYNRQDVLVLERYYRRIMPWIGSPGHMSPNAAHWAGGKLVCTKIGCGSENVVRRGTDKRGAVNTWQVIQCKDCRGYSRIRTSKPVPTEQKVRAV